MLINEDVKSNWLHIFIEDKMIANSLVASEAIQEFNETASGQANPYFFV